jgi:hypothetical protein
MECRVCFFAYSCDGEKQPNILVNCGHSFCKQCISKLPKQECPVCRKRFINKACVPNYDLIDVLLMSKSSNKTIAEIWEELQKEDRLQAKKAQKQARLLKAVEKNKKIIRKAQRTLNLLTGLDPNYDSDDNEVRNNHLMNAINRELRNSNQTRQTIDEDSEEDEYEVEEEDTEEDEYEVEEEDTEEDEQDLDEEEEESEEYNSEVEEEESEENNSEESSFLLSESSDSISEEETFYLDASVYELKLCGHTCTISSIKETCCACGDKRPLNELSTRYLDGRTTVLVSRDYYYCPSCKSS